VQVDFDVVARGGHHRTNRPVTERLEVAQRNTVVGTNFDGVNLA